MKVKKISRMTRKEVFEVLRVNIMDQEFKDFFQLFVEQEKKTAEDRYAKKEGKKEKTVDVRSAVLGLISIQPLTVEGKLTLGFSLYD